MGSKQLKSAPHPFQKPDGRLAESEFLWGAVQTLEIPKLTAYFYIFTNLYEALVLSFESLTTKT